MQRWVVIAGAILLLVVALFIPKPSPNSETPPMPITTVPPALGPSEAPSRAASTVAVYVCGSVKKPGVYFLSAGKRVVDAIAAAGGDVPKADLEELNLAEPLVDGMKVAVPMKGEHAPAQSEPRLGVRHAAGSHAHSRAGAHGIAHPKLQPGQTLDINTANADELVSLPGVGRGLARRIVDYRQENGPFQTIDDLQNVAGIGPSKFEKLQGYLRL